MVQTDLQSPLVAAFQTTALCNYKQTPNLIQMHREKVMNTEKKC